MESFCPEIASILIHKDASILISWRRFHLLHYRCLHLLQSRRFHLLHFWCLHLLQSRCLRLLHSRCLHLLQSRRFCLLLDDNHGAHVACILSSKTWSNIFPPLMYICKTNENKDLTFSCMLKLYQKKWAKEITRLQKVFCALRISDNFFQFWA